MAKVLTTDVAVDFPQGIYEISMVINSGSVQLSRSLVAGTPFNNSDDMLFTDSVIRSIRSTGGQIKAVFTDATVTISDVSYK